MSLSVTTVCSLTDVLCVTAVMDITDVAHGKTDDEDKQHFIPFQQWVFWCCHTSSSAVYWLNLGVFFVFFFQRHNWAEIMGNIWNRTCAAVFAYCVPSRLFSRMHFEYFLRCCFSRTNMKTFFFLQYLFVKGRLQGHVFHSTCSPGGKEDDDTGV